jgi:hypothetical protein
MPAEWCPGAARVRIGNPARGGPLPLHPAGMPSGRRPPLSEIRGSLAIMSALILKVLFIKLTSQALYCRSGPCAYPLCCREQRNRTKTCDRPGLIS